MLLTHLDQFILSCYMNKIKVAAVVVLFHPNKVVLANIMSYINQVEKIYVIDNSETTNQYVTDKIKEIENVEYILNISNVGIGKAFNVGAERAIREGFEFLLTMDQDSKASKEMIKRMLFEASGISNVGIITPIHGNKFNTQECHIGPYTEKFDVMSSGNLVNLQILSKVGEFNEQYFIDFVDIEYYLRLHIAHYKIIQVNSALLFHSEGNIQQQRFLFWKVYPYHHSPIRYYYKARNRLYLRAKYKSKFPEYFKKKEKKVFRNTVIKMLFLEKKRALKIRYLFKGYIDYKNGILGKFGSGSN